jgi:hypothetical protein
MAASASFLTVITASFTRIAAVELIRFDVADAQRLETLHR